MKKPHPFLRVVFFGIVFLALLTATRWFKEHRRGDVIHEVTSEFSHIRVRETGNIRSLLFVDDRGTEQLQSSIDLSAPEVMLVDYTKTMFASLLFTPSQKRILIVGLGGGGMVRFAESALPETQIEAVEIDPEVVRVAAEYFETKNGPRISIHTIDAFEFLRAKNGAYDAIYMDAFLKPKAGPELDELTKRLKTVEFLEDVKSRLSPDGLVAFNLIAWYPTTRGDIASIREVFPSVYRFSVPGTGNLVVIATQKEGRMETAQLLERAEKLKKELNVGLPFGEFVENLSN